MKQPVHSSETIYRKTRSRKEPTSTHSIKHEYGYVYVLENEKDPGKYKIGKTKEKSGLNAIQCIEDRIKGYQTGSAGKLKIVFYLYTKLPLHHEKIIQIMLKKFNCDYGGGSEWFENIPLEKIKEIATFVSNSYDFIDYEATKKKKRIIYLSTMYETNGSKPMMIDFEEID
jgi:hypothetical protein